MAGPETAAGEDLTAELIHAGRALVERLDERAIGPAVAFWFCFPDETGWRLVLADGNLRRGNPVDPYRRVEKILMELPTRVSAALEDLVGVAKVDSVLVDAVRAAVHTGPGLTGISIRDNVINGVRLSRAYVYRVSD